MLGCFARESIPKTGKAASRGYGRSNQGAPSRRTAFRGACAACSASYRGRAEWQPGSTGESCQAAREERRTSKEIASAAAPHGQGC